MGTDGGLQNQSIMASLGPTELSAWPLSLEHTVLHYSQISLTVVTQCVVWHTVQLCHL